jgi:SAM-dependent methyltransferase
MCFYLTNASWDETYEREIRNNDEDGDAGQVWFGTDTQRRMLAWTVRKLLQVDEDDQPDPKLKVLDIGTGNGMALIKLAKTYQFEPSQLYGMDYSERAVQLAEQVAAQKLNKKKKTDDDDDDGKDADNGDENTEQPKSKITFFAGDLLSEDIAKTLPTDELRATAPFDIVMDKGTFDAMSLQGHDISTEYIRGLKKLVKRETGWFVITSCNFTRDEIIQLFATKGGLKLHGHLPYPEIKFGGQSGSTVCTVAFHLPTDL